MKGTLNFFLSWSVEIGSVHVRCVHAKDLIVSNTLNGIHITATADGHWKNAMHCWLEGRS